MCKKFKKNTNLLPVTVPVGTLVHGKSAQLGRISGSAMGCMAWISDCSIDFVYRVVKGGAWLGYQIVVWSWDIRYKYRTVLCIS